MSTQAESPVGELISQLDHPVTLSYAGEALVLSAREVRKNVSKARLGALPRGVAFVVRNPTGK